MDKKREEIVAKTEVLGDAPAERPGTPQEPVQGRKPRVADRGPKAKRGEVRSRILQVAREEFLEKDTKARQFETWPGELDATRHLWRTISGPSNACSASASTYLWTPHKRYWNKSCQEGKAPENGLLTSCSPCMRSI